LKKISKDALIYFGALLVLLSVFTSINNTKNYLNFVCHILKNPPGIANLVHELWDSNTSRDDAQLYSSFVMHGSAISPKAKMYLNNYSVDIYPFENTFAYTNNLNWTPRFLFHGYMTYTPELDKKNVEFLSSDKAPDYILWHKVLLDFDTDFAKRGVLSFDRKYIFNDDPQTMQAFLNYYGDIKDFDNVFILKKLDKPINYKKEYSNDFSFEYNKWIDVPQKDDYITLISLKFKRTLYGKLMNSINRDAYAYVDYEFFDNTITRYKINSIDNLEAGLWVNPHVWEINDNFESRKVKRIRITVDNPKNLNNKIEAKWINIERTFDMWFQPDFSNDKILNNMQNYLTPILTDRAYVQGRSEEVKNKPLQKKITLNKDKTYIFQVEGSAASKTIIFPKIAAASIITNCNSAFDGTDFMLIFDGKTHTYNMIYKPENKCELKETSIIINPDRLNPESKEKPFTFKVFEVKAK
jgi:hypothetical protein